MVTVEDVRVWVNDRACGDLLSFVAKNAVKFLI